MSYLIQSYIKYHEKFVPLAEATQEVEDSDYVNGALIWEIDGKQILSIEHWDLIDQLWSYILNALFEFIENGQAQGYFPDQPLYFAFKMKSNNQVAVTIAKTTCLVNKSSFFDSLLEGSETFFHHVLEWKIIAQRDELTKRELARIEELRTLRDNV